MRRAGHRDGSDKRQAPDLYDALGVDRHVSDRELKKAYRSRAQETHPDHGGDADEFKTVALAYRTLSDPVARANYDATGDAGKTWDPTGVAIGYVMSAFAAVCQKYIHCDPGDFDLIEEVRRQCEKAADDELRQVRENIDGAEHSILVLQELQRRLSRKKRRGQKLAPPIFENAIEENIRDAKKSIGAYEAQGERIRRRTKEADNLLDSYEFKCNVRAKGDRPYPYPGFTVPDFEVSSFDWRDIGEIMRRASK